MAQEAAELIEQRKAYLKSGLNLRGIGSKHKAKEAPHFLDSGEKSTPLLGIGTGGDDLETAADIVAESPTGVDFDIYDRAYEAEVMRIRSEPKKKRSWTYMTKMLGERERDKYAGDDCMIVEAGESLVQRHEAECSSSSHRDDEKRGQREYPDIKDEGEVQEEEGFPRAVEAAKEKGSRFADLVVSLTRDMKDKATTREEGD